MMQELTQCFQALHNKIARLTGMQQLTLFLTLQQALALQPTYNSEAHDPGPDSRFTEDAYWGFAERVTGMARTLLGTSFGVEYNTNTFNSARNNTWNTLNVTMNAAAHPVSAMQLLPFTTSTNISAAFANGTAAPKSTLLARNQRKHARALSQDAQQFSSFAQEDNNAMKMGAEIKPRHAFTQHFMNHLLQEYEKFRASGGDKFHQCTKGVQKGHAKLFFLNCCDSKLFGEACDGVFRHYPKCGEADANTKKTCDQEKKKLIEETKQKLSENGKAPTKKELEEVEKKASEAYDGCVAARMINPVIDQFPRFVRFACWFTVIVFTTTNTEPLQGTDADPGAVIGSRYPDYTPTIKLSMGFHTFQMFKMQVWSS